MARIITTETTKEVVADLGHIARFRKRPVGSEALMAIEAHIARNQAALKAGKKMPKIGS